jgi:hypothetical protein
MIYKYLKLILSFISDISWPLIIVLFVFLFEDQIRFLIKNLKKGSAGSLSFEIDQNHQNPKEISTLDSEISNTSPNNELNEYLELYSQSSREIVASSIIRESKSIIGESKDFEKLLTFTTLLYFEKHFQSIYNIIYGSQIEILDKLNTNNNETKESLKYIFDNAVNRSPDFYKDYSYGQYLNFLERYALIYILENNNILIGDQGKDFLTFVNRLGLSKTKNWY